MAIPEAYQTVMEAILKTHPDRKIILKVLNELVNGKVFLSTRRTLARELKLPLYSIDRILYLLVALQLVAIEVAGRTHIASPTIFAE